MGSVPESKKMDPGRPGMKSFLDIPGIQVMMGKAGHLEAQAPRIYLLLLRRRNKAPWQGVGMSAAG